MVLQRIGFRRQEMKRKLATSQLFVEARLSPLRAKLGARRMRYTKWCFMVLLSAPISILILTSLSGNNLDPVSNKSSLMAVIPSRQINASWTTTCKENPSSNWTITLLESKDDYPDYKELSEFLEGPALHKGHELKHAACLIRQTKYWMIFPHTMQQLYRCWSYWLANKDKRPVLIWMEHKRIRVSPFLSGFVDMLQKGINLEVVWQHPKEGNHSYYESYVKAKDTTKWSKTDIEITDFALVDPTRQLNKLFESQVQSIKVAGCINNLKENYPKISILNRSEESKRNLVDAEALAYALQLSMPKSSKIRIDFFENKTFMEQAQFMAETDILISPHGAQLTSIPFLPPCASMLEFLPKQYLVADFYGSLAKAAGIHHSFFYLADDTAIIPHNERYHYYRSRKYRANSQCPPLDKVVAAVHEMIKIWQQCCSTASTKAGAR